MSDFDVEWVDGNREPVCAPDPAYPNGIDVDFTAGRAPACRVSLPYPAQRCGFYMLKCRVCALTMILTTAGRADDPRSVTIPCRLPVAPEVTGEAGGTAPHRGE
jgi:hypothetical protein